VPVVVVRGRRDDNREATEGLCRQYRPGSLADQCRRGVDAHHQVVGTRHVGSSEQVPVPEQLRQRLSAPRNAVAASRDQDGTESPATMLSGSPDAGRRLLQRPRNDNGLPYAEANHF
jgi:hypothetical protein